MKFLQFFSEFSSAVRFCMESDLQVFQPNLLFFVSILSLHQLFNGFVVGSLDSFDLILVAVGEFCIDVVLTFDIALLLLQGDF